MATGKTSVKPSREVRALKITVFMLFFTILMSPGLSVARGTAGDQPQFVAVVQSQKSFAATLKAFREEVNKAGWSVLNAHNMAGVLSERGFTLNPVVIFDVCSGKYSASILGRDDYRPVSVFMPCRVSIYQTTGGKVYIARMNSGAFAKMMPPEVAEVMSASDEEVSKIITKTAQ